MDYLMSASVISKSLNSLAFGVPLLGLHGTNSTRNWGAWFTISKIYTLTQIPDTKTCLILSILRKILYLSDTLCSFVYR